MLYREIMAFCSQIHTKHINTVCGQNVELLKCQCNIILIWLLCQYHVLPKARRASLERAEGHSTRTVRCVTV